MIALDDTFLRIEAAMEAAIAVRLAMWRNGYAPLPVNGKNPDINGPGWQLKRQQTNEAEIRLWSKVWPYCFNTGCLTRNTPTLDVDIVHKDACWAVFKRIREQFEGHGAVLCRIGNAPKFAVPFRTNAPFGKITQKVISPDGVVMKFEFLGDGQQFVAHGRHPTAGVDYRWWPDGRDLVHVPRSVLPVIDEAGAHALVQELVDLIIHGFGFTLPAEKPARIRPVNGSRSNASCSPHAIQRRLSGLYVLVAKATPPIGGAPGERNSALFWAAMRINDMIDSGELSGEDATFALDCLHEAALRNGLPTREISRTIASAAKTASRAS
jgi:Bifunctional DNA primase/polymerase, N-terminal